MRRTKKAQAILDYILVISAVMALAIGLVRVWIYFNANLASSSVAYGTSRVAAGTANDVHFSAAYADAQYTNKHLDLTEDWVFRGTASGGVGSNISGTLGVPSATSGGSSGADAVCSSAQESAATLREQANDMEDEKEDLEDFRDLIDDWYDPLYWVALILGIDADDLSEAIDEMEEGITQMRAQADSLEAQACGTASSGQSNYNSIYTNNGRLPSGTTVDW